MRIALITETFTTGVGRHIADLMGELGARGHQLHLLYGDRRFDPALVRSVQALPGVQLCALPMRRAPHPQDLRSLWTMWRYLRRHGPFDVLHGHSSKGGAYARLLGALLRVRCLYTPHALVTLAPDLGRPARLIYGTVERLLAPLPTASSAARPRNARMPLQAGWAHAAAWWCRTASRRLMLRPLACGSRLRCRPRCCWPVSSGGWNRKRRPSC